MIAADGGSPTLRSLAADKVQVVTLNSDAEPQLRQPIGNPCNTVTLFRSEFPSAPDAGCTARHRCREREDRYLINGERHILRGDLHAVEVGTANAKVADRLTGTVIWAWRLFDGCTHAAQDLNDMAAGGVQRDATDRQIGIWVQACGNEPEGGGGGVARNVHLWDRSQLRLALHADKPAAVFPLRAADRGAARHKHALAVVARCDTLYIGGAAACGEAGNQDTALHLRARRL